MRIIFKRTRIDVPPNYEKVKQAEIVKKINNS